MNKFEKLMCMILGALIAVLLTILFVTLQTAENSKIRTDAQVNFFNWFIETQSIN